MKRTIYSLSLAACMTLVVQAQENAIITSSSDLTIQQPTDVTIPYNIEDEGKAMPIIWGMDTAWPDEGNMKRGIAFIGAENLGTARASFQPNDKIVNGSLSTRQINALNNRLRLIRLSGVKDIMLNCDHEALMTPENATEAQKIQYEQHRANYVGKPEEWVKLIEATARHCQQMGFNVVSVAPFNEPDFGWNQGSRNDFYEIAKLLKANPFFDNIRICGGNTLNCDQALPWYNALKEYLDEGNTHQLAGEFDKYANFFSTVRSEGKHATADELHNVMEAMVGVEYGMQTGIWWGFDGLARGEFCRASNNGVRLAYAEDRPHWTAGAVYRNEKEGKVQAFVGSSERQANNSSYLFVSKGMDVYYDGYGPVRDFLIDMPGGTGYQVGQTNAERVVNITWGEDVQPYINGNYVLMNMHSGRVLSLASANPAAGSSVSQRDFVSGATHQQWHVEPTKNRIGGDFSYYTITSLHSKGFTMDVLNWGLGTADIIAYDANYGANQQWYLQYAGNGNFYIRSRHSSLYLEVAGAGTFNGAKIQQAAFSGLPKQQWRFIPIGEALETTAPAAPTGLKSTVQTASVLLEWEANNESDLAGYSILRAEKPTDDATPAYNTICRGITGTAFIDNEVRQGVTYLYKLKATDKSGNISATSDVIEACMTNKKALIAQWQFDDSLNDNTENRMGLVFNGTPIYTAIHQSGEKALMLNTSNHYARLPYDIANMNEMTICCWVRLREKTAWQRIFDFGNGTEQYMFFTPNNGNEARFVMKNGGDEEILSTTPLALNTWVHVAISIGQEAITIYVNGKEMAHSTSMTLRPDDICPTLNYIGRSQFKADPTLKGYIDDFRVYNYALDAEEVAAVTEDLASQIKENDSATQSPITTIEYYSLNGTRVAHPTEGIYIVRYIRADGSVEIEKIIK